MFLTKEIICNRINGRLRERRLGQSDLAVYLGVNVQTVGNKLGGKTEFTLSELLKVKKYLDMYFNI